MDCKEDIFVIVSGGFDPIHIGHVRMIEDSAKVGEVIVILNNDNWLKKKKGYCFMSEQERRHILENIKGVHKVIMTKHKENDEDTSVVNSLAEIRESFKSNLLIFANGGDRISSNTPEVDYCMKHDIKLLFNVGGGKVQSSSELVKRAGIRIEG